MIKIQRFVFNNFYENTYLLYDEDTGKAVIIDAGCSSNSEEKELSDFITKMKLEPVIHLLTHAHIDHILGVGFLFENYRLSPVMHQQGLPYLQSAPQQARMFGINEIEIVEPTEFIDEKSEIQFGNSKLDVLYTPGHIDGHVCYVNHKQKFVLAGDVLFREGVGRWDLPSGNESVLFESIKCKLYTLPADYVVFPGHGPETTIGHEKHNNPFIRG
jgi:hydroxyacylglutathione hydrolase